MLYLTSMKQTQTLLITALVAVSLIAGGCASTPTAQTPTTTNTPPVAEAPMQANGKIAAREIKMTGCKPKAITISEPEANFAVTFPLTVKATVHNAEQKACSWTMFEAQAASMEVKDSTGKVVATGVLMAKGEWMTDAPVSFEGTLKSVDGVTPRGVLDLVITEENPSGMKDSQTITIPVYVQADNI